MRKITVYTSGVFKCDQGFLNVTLKLGNYQKTLNCIESYFSVKSIKKILLNLVALFILYKNFPMF